MPPLPYDRLSSTDLLVALLMGHGHGERQIAERLDLTVPAVIATERRICAEFGVTGRHEAVAVLMADDRFRSRFLEPVFTPWTPHG